MEVNARLWGDGLMNSCPVISNAKFQGNRLMGVPVREGSGSQFPRQSGVFTHICQRVCNCFVGERSVILDE